VVVVVECNVLLGFDWDFCSFQFCQGTRILQRFYPFYRLYLALAFIITIIISNMAALTEEEEEEEEEDVRLNFEAPDAPTEAEAAHDRHRARRFAAALRAAVPGADPHVEDLYPWPQARVWRLPVAFGVPAGRGGGGAAAARVDASHFRAVAALGGALVVEAPRGDCVESGCVIELPMSRFWLRRFGPNERRLCMLAALALVAGLAGVGSHAVPLAQQVWGAFVRSTPTHGQ
jgi:hypothetical protein